MSNQNFRHGRSPAQIMELLETLKTELEILAHDANLHKMQKEDLERKYSAQQSEINSIQAYIAEMEKSQHKMRQQYEEEFRMKRQADMHQYGNGSAPPNGEAFIDKRGPPMINNGFGGPPPGYPQPPHLPPQQAQQPQQPPIPPQSASHPQQPQPHYPPAMDQMHPPKRQRIDEAHENPHGLPALGGFEGGFGGKFGGIAPKEKEPMPQGQSLVLNPLAQQSGLPLPQGGKNPRQTAPVMEMPENTPKPLEQKIQYPDEKDGTNSDWVIGHHLNAQTKMVIEPVHTLDHSSVVCCVKFSSDGKYLATGSNKSANIFDNETGEKIHVFDGSVGTLEGPNADQYIRSVCFSPDGKYLAAGGEDRTVKVWDIERKSISHTFSGHTHEIYSLDFSQNSNIIVSGGGDRKVRVWDLETRKCLYELGGDEMGPKDGVTSVAFSPDGRFIAAGSLDCVVRLWETHTGYFLDRFEGHADSVYSVAFSPDGKSLASGSLDKTLKLWDLSNSKQKARATFNGHKDYVLSVAFSPEGEWLVSGSKDRTVQFWDPRNAMAQFMLQGHKNSVISVAMSPVSGTLATGSGDNRARIWKYRPSPN